ncbi:MAG: hypothetical protein EOM05_10995 [Clostridia bacterium]|nr:hypothetical protein [Clostridia bacterium]
MSNRITSITKRDIFKLFINGLDIDVIFGDTQHVAYPYYGLLSEIVFLNRLYNLKTMISNDSRFENAESDIWQHTENNDDYEFGWIFSDDRFPLKNGSDEEFLTFLCEVFHPEVRNEQGYWKEFLNEVNRLLANDDLELYPIQQISNHDVYGWRLVSQNQNIYLPFSQRNRDTIKSSTLKLSIKYDCRDAFLKAFQTFDETLYLTDDTGWNYNSNTIQEVFKTISKYYEPMCFNDEGKYATTESFDKFILKTSPYCVFDAIEIFSQITSSEEYVGRINALLSLHKLDYQLKSGIISNFVTLGISDEQIGAAPEVGITELLQKAKSSFNQGDKQDAIEKLWDAFERVKTIYTDCDKKQSVTKIINMMSSKNPGYSDMLNKEFQELTNIGNKFRIRHHEMDKIKINDDSYYNYFCGRCSMLIILVLKYIKNVH